MPWKNKGRNKRMTCEEFEYEYAKRSGMTVEQLRQSGVHAIPCKCAEDDCRGWQMTFTTINTNVRNHFSQTLLPKNSQVTDPEPLE